MRIGKVTTEVGRPVLRYHGGKWRLAPWILSYFPSHRVYVEPYAGAASVLLRKPRSYAEVYNDLDGEIVNLFRILRDPAQARELIRLVHLTPYARAEYELSYITAGDPIEQARRTLLRSFAGFSSVGATGKWRTGFRANVNHTWTTPAGDWISVPGTLEQAVERLRGVVIENEPAIDIIHRYDEEKALFYVDPPYVQTTRYIRWAGEAYKFEMTDEQHRELADVLQSLSGYVVLSGYACDLNQEFYPGWHRVEKDAHADGAKDRVEVLWLSPRTWKALQDGNGLPLFDGSR